MEAEVFPRCPHCKEEIKGVRWLNEDLAHIRIFICPECKTILSIQEWYGASTPELFVSNLKTQARVF